MLKVGQWHHVPLLIALKGSSVGLYMGNKVD